MKVDIARRILVTGTGGTGGIDFVRALRLAETQRRVKLFLVCTDHNPHYLQFPEADVRCISPKHDDPHFVKTLLLLIKKHGVEFLHPHPSSEARVVSEYSILFRKARVETYLPQPASIMPNKLEIYEALSRQNVPVPRTAEINSLSDVNEAFSRIGRPLWIRAKQGAGGRLGLKVNTSEEAEYWMKLNVLQNRASNNDFLLQEYLPGRDLAFDSLWFRGKLITSYSRERLEYPLKHISLSGITGTPAIARTVKDQTLNQVGVQAVKALDPKPHGFFSVDAKEDAAGKPVITEVDGKWHTTAPLWGYAFAKVLKRPDLNIVYTYLMLGLNKSFEDDLPRVDLFPSNYYLVRQLDAGVILESDESKWRIV